MPRRLVRAPSPSVGLRELPVVFAVPVVFAAAGRLRGGRALRASPAASRATVVFTFGALLPCAAATLAEPISTTAHAIETIALMGTSAKARLRATRARARSGQSRATLVPELGPAAAKYPTYEYLRPEQSAHQAPPANGARSGSGMTVWKFLPGGAQRIPLAKKLRASASFRELWKARSTTSSAAEPRATGRRRVLVASAARQTSSGAMCRV